MEVGNRDIGRLALEKCQNPSGKIDYLPDTRFGERGTKFMTTLARSGPLVIHFEKTSSTIDVGNRAIGGLALEKCRNPSEKVNYLPDTRFGERGTKFVTTLARSGPLVIHFEKTSSTMDVGNRDIGGLALEKCRKLSEKVDYLPDTRFGERGTKFMTTLARSGPLVIHFEKKHQALWMSGIAIPEVWHSKNVEIQAKKLIICRIRGLRARNKVYGHSGALKSSCYTFKSIKHWMSGIAR